MEASERLDCNPREKGFCINKVFQRDGFINCPPPHCTDEGKCKEFSRNPNAASANQIDFFIIFSVFALFLNYQF